MEYKQFNRKLATLLGKALLVAGMLLGSGAVQAGEPALLEAVNSDFRREANVERDQYRHLQSRHWLFSGSLRSKP